MSENIGFGYSPLIGRDAIRLLILQPGEPGSDVYCSLVHTALWQCHEDIFLHYTALSYVWGDATQKRTIFVNKSPFDVTHNLFDALHDLRDAQNNLRLWADAISINQSDIAEREQQVGLMRQIYSFAEFTVIYLGKSNEEIDVALNSTRREGDAKIDEKFQSTIANQILTRPWFTRVWIYQELVLSAKPWVQCGRGRVRWDSLHSAFSKSSVEGPRLSCDHSSHSRSRPLSPIEVFSDMDGARKQMLPPPKLLDVLLSRRGFGASDPRDLIYGHFAVAGLPTKFDSPRCPIVDYELSAVEVFTAATRYMLSAISGFPIGDCHPLLHAEPRDYSRRMKGLPSWVPDWSLPSSEYASPIPWISSTSYGKWQTSGNPFRQKWPPQGKFQRQSPPVTINVGLVFVGTISSFKSESDPAMKGRPEIQILLSNIKAAVSEREGNSRHTTLISGASSPAEISDPLLKKVQLYRDAHRLLHGWFGTVFLPISHYSNESLSVRAEFNLFWNAAQVSEDRDVVLWGQISWEDNDDLPGEILLKYILLNTASILDGRKVAVISYRSHDLLGIVPALTRSGDNIYALPRNVGHGQEFVVLRQLSRPGNNHGFPDSESGKYHQNTWRDESLLQEEKHCTLIGRSWMVLKNNTEAGNELCTIREDPIVLH